MTKKNVFPGTMGSLMNQNCFALSINFKFQATSIIGVKLIKTTWIFLHRISSIDNNNNGMNNVQSQQYTCHRAEINTVL